MKAKKKGDKEIREEKRKMADGMRKREGGRVQDFTKLVAGGIGRNKRSTSAPKQDGLLARNGEKTEKYEKSRGGLPIMEQIKWEGKGRRKRESETRGKMAYPIGTGGIRN